MTELEWFTVTVPDVPPPLNPLPAVTPVIVPTLEVLLFQLVISLLVIPAAALALKIGSVSVKEVKNPLSLVKSLVLVGTVIVIAPVLTLTDVTGAHVYTAVFHRAGVISLLVVPVPALTSASVIPE